MSRVLIVDDNKQILFMLQELFKSFGYSVVSAANGEEALQKARLDPPDIIISDILMPVMDGFALCHEWKNDKSLKKIPFVIYSAEYTDKTDENLALRLGVDRFIRKPMATEKFMKIVQGILADIKHGDKKAGKSLVKEREMSTDDFKLYNERLIKKLEQKMIDLEKEVCKRKVGEEMLRHAEKEWRHTFDSITDFVYVCDNSYKLQKVNKAFTVFFRKSADELIGKHCYELFHALRGPINQCPRPEMMKEKKSITREIYDQHLGLYFMETVSPIFDKKGEVSGSVHFFKDITERKSAEEALQSIFEGTVSDTGNEFFFSLVNHLAMVLKVRYALISQLTGTDRLQTIAVWTGEGFADNFEYSLAGTPCEGIIKESTCIYPENVQREFPDDHILVEMGVESYLGIPLRDAGNVVGLLAVMDDKPMKETPRAMHLIQVFASRASAEINRIRALDSLKESEAQLRALTGRLAEVEEFERKRLAQELHDKVGPNLTALSINMSIMKNVLSPELPEEVKSRLVDSTVLVEETAESIRDVMAELRPQELDAYGLMAALHWYGGNYYKRTGIAVGFQGKEFDPRLPQEMETAFYRIALEAMTNVVKHARASRITVVFEEANNFAGMTIADNGLGFDIANLDPKERSGWGLVNMRERIQAFGGKIQVESSPGEGTRVVIEVER